MCSYVCVHNVCVIVSTVKSDMFEINLLTGVRVMDKVQEFEFLKQPSQTDSHSEQILLVFQETIFQLSPRTSETALTYLSPTGWRKPGLQTNKVQEFLRQPLYIFLWRNARLQSSHVIVYISSNSHSELNVFVF